ncbi:DUF6881 domain-containing protein [Hirschia litorea]|uniref:DUF6881 domain-containing protein n=1 Tax=Hirschia litorea TaxID=1199156 RepID=A0ABW2IKJ8_9PROT
MSAKYLRVMWHDTLPDEPMELYYEIQPTRCVTRMIEIFEDGYPIADSLKIAARRYPPPANPNCLCNGSFPGPLEYDTLFQTSEFSYNEISKTQFDKLFLRANIKE